MMLADPLSCGAGQKCFFLRKEPRTHKANHDMDIVIDSSNYDQFKWCAFSSAYEGTVSA